MKAVIVACGLLMLGGCASGGASNPPWLALNSSCAKLSGDQELSMNLADDMAKMEREIRENVWLTCDADETLIFGADHELKWTKALAKIGVDARLLSATAGRA